MTPSERIALLSARLKKRHEARDRLLLRDAPQSSPAPSVLVSKPRLTSHVHYKKIAGATIITNKLVELNQPGKRISANHAPESKFGQPCDKCGRHWSKHYVYHEPQGNPCTICRLPKGQHRVRTQRISVEHTPQGDPCTQCGKAAIEHRIRKHEFVPFEHNAATGNRDPSCRKCGMYAAQHVQRKNKNWLYVGIDGEGQGRQCHRYVLLAASTEDRSQSWSIQDYEKGLTTKQCLNFILYTLPSNVRPFGYALGYDWTKILADLPDKTLYLLFRPELRQRKGKEAMKGPVPVKWQGYSLNMQGTKFTVRKGPRRVVVWDIFKFYQGKFVTALKEWKIGNKERLDHIARMKDRRSELDKESPEAIRAYCLDECAYMAELARTLTEAHKKVGLKLKAYYGAGSSAGAMLKVMGIQAKLKPPPEEMRQAVAQAFFGGRFENSVVGTIEGTVYNYDISSAYPYQLCFLPCQIHGTWEKTKNEKDLWTTPTGLIHYSLDDIAKAKKGLSWGPFPYRDKTGTICFPRKSPGGWLWREEFLRGKELFGDVVRFHEAYVWRQECGCQPFKRIPEYYLERIRIGKEGPGIVLKLGMNSCYGKLAQSIGKAIFNSWVWAGIITSGCRAQMLEMMLKHTDLSNLLMIATDGAYTRERILMPNPKDTNTNSVPKPLGGWEEKAIEKGVFVARPGIYFPMNPTIEEIKDVRGRGVGKGVVLENWRMIVDAWLAKKESVTVANVSRFIGAKSAIHRNSRGTYTRASRIVSDLRSPAYGEWVSRPVAMSFDPAPKRASIADDGRTLIMRSIGHNAGESIPYTRAMRIEEVDALMDNKLMMNEQPDLDWSDYG